MSFTNETIDIVNFLIKNYNNLFKIKRKRETNNILLEIFKMINMSEKEIIKIKNENKIEKNIEKNTTFDNELMDLLNGRFTPPQIKEYINNNNTNVAIFKTVVNKRNITLNFYTTEKEDYSLDELENKAVLFFTIFNFLSMSSNSRCGETIKINLFLTDFKKNLPSNKNNILGCDNVNSAATYHCAKNGTILIFRKEEMIKVFIHESMHALGLDWFNNSVLNDDIQSIFHIKSKFLINESYVEFWANILNCCLISYKINKLDKKKYLSHVNYCINFEILFSIFQIVKILKYMGLSYKQLYKSDPVNKKMCNDKYKETSNVFSYYILKSVFLFNYNGFLNLCKEHNHKLFNFISIENKRDILINFIKNNYSNKKFLKTIDAIKCKKTDTLNYFMNNTLRLTAMEYDI